jgi:hypothetical protein
MAALKRHEVIMLDSLNAFALTLYTLGHTTESAICDALKTQIEAFEIESGMRTLIKDLPDGGFYFQEVDPRNDFLRSRIAAGGAQQTLKAKLSGIQIDIKVRKDEVFEFKNKEIAKALEEYAEIVRHMPVEASIVGEDDFPNGLGAYPVKMTPDSPCNDAAGNEGLGGSLVNDDDDDLISSNSINLDDALEPFQPLQNDGDHVEVPTGDAEKVGTDSVNVVEEALSPSNEMSLHPSANK